MRDIFLCYIDTVDFVVPNEINIRCKEKIDIVKNNEAFQAAILIVKKSNEQFYIASQASFYQVFSLLIDAGVKYEQIIKPPPIEQVVKIHDRDYQMKAEFLTNPSKPIDRKIAKQNLLQFKEVLDAVNLKFFLVYGTLLGAVRESDFIAHDSDVDVGIYHLDKDKFISLLFELKDVGIELVRFDDDLISLMKNGEYIDIYFFKKKYFPRLGWHSGRYFIPAKYLNALEFMDFYGRKFFIPQHHLKLLIFLYGKHWRTPKIDNHAQPQLSIKVLIAKALPIRVKQHLKNMLKALLR